MNNKELIEKLKTFPPDARVKVNFETWAEKDIEDIILNIDPEDRQLDKINTIYIII